MNTSNDFAGAVLVLSDSSLAEETAAYVADVYFDTTEYHFVLSESTPAHFPDTIRSDTAAKQAAVEGETNVLTVYPWAQAEIKSGLERPTNG